MKGSLPARRLDLLVKKASDGGAGAGGGGSDAGPTKRSLPFYTFQGSHDEPQPADFLFDMEIDPSWTVLHLKELVATQLKDVYAWEARSRQSSVSHSASLFLAHGARARPPARWSLEASCGCASSARRSSWMARL